MKKIISLILVLISLFSFFNIAFADINTYNSNIIPSFGNYIGFWYGKSDDKEYSLCILPTDILNSAYQATLYQYDASGKSFSHPKVYNMSYDVNAKQIYLTLANDITKDLYYKIQYNDGILYLYRLDSSWSLAMNKQN